MPEAGQTISAKKLGKKYRGRFIWAICADCGKGRWVQGDGGKPRSLRCRPCNARLGREHKGNWKGGAAIRRGRYMVVRVARDDFFYPMADSDSYVLEHRLVMAKSLGRCLQPWEIIHHRNSIKTDNRVGNLQLVTDDRHRQITLLENKIKFQAAKISTLEAELNSLKPMLNDRGGATRPCL
jgi:hypothetical protein